MVNHMPTSVNFCCIMPSAGILDVQIPKFKTYLLSGLQCEISVEDSPFQTQIHVAFYFVSVLFHLYFAVLVSFKSWSYVCKTPCDLDTERIQTDIYL